MELSWKDALKVYAPYIVLLLLNAVGGLYAFGYAQGQRSILTASADAAKEAMNG